MESAATTKKLIKIKEDIKEDSTKTSEENDANNDIIIKAVEHLTKIFKNKEFRIIKDNTNKYYFVAKDICSILNYKHMFNYVDKISENPSMYTPLKDSK